MLDVMSKLKTGKASASFVKAEHILYGSPRLAYHLHILFNAMIQHSYVPYEFLNGVISPLIKDSEGNHSDLQNYRGLTLGVVLFSFIDSLSSLFCSIVSLISSLLAYLYLLRSF